MTAKTPGAASGARAATISLGGDARAHPDLEPLIRPLFAADLTPTGDGETVPLIRRHPANPRRGDHDAIVKSIRNNGVYSPIKVQRSTGYVLAGNHTLDAILDQGGTSAPWVWLDVDDDEARRWAMRSAEARGFDAVLQLDDNIDVIGLLNANQPAFRSALDPGTLLRLITDVCLSTNTWMVGAQLSSVVPKGLTSIVRPGYPYSIFAERTGAGRMPYHGPFEDDIMHALEYALNGGPHRTAGVIDVVRYNKEHKARTGGMRTQYGAHRGLEIANRYPKNVRIGMGPRTSGSKDASRGVRHFLNTRGFTPVTVTDPDRFRAADAGLRAGVAAALEAKREWDRQKIARRALRED